MIVRIYRATPKPDKRKEYEALLMDEVIPYVRKSKGCLEAKVLKSLGVVREILFITVWDSLESVKEFCGTNWKTAVLVGNEVELIEGTPEVKHYHQIASF